MSERLCLANFSPFAQSRSVQYLNCTLADLPPIYHQYNLQPRTNNSTTIFDMAEQEKADATLHFILASLACNKDVLSIDWHQASAKTGMTLARNWSVANTIGVKPDSHFLFIELTVAKPAPTEISCFAHKHFLITGVLLNYHNGVPRRKSQLHVHPRGAVHLSSH